MLEVIIPASSKDFEWLVGDKLKVSKSKRALKNSHTISKQEAGRLVNAEIAKWV